MIRSARHRDDQSRLYEYAKRKGIHGKARSVDFGAQEGKDALLTGPGVCLTMLAIVALNAKTCFAWFRSIFE